MVATLALVAGDAAMAGVAAAARATVPGPGPVAWLAAAGVIAASSYALVGVPQIALGRRHGAQRDRRGAWAIRLLGRTEPGQRQGMAAVAFVAASVVAGPLAVGWFAGRREDPKAHRNTAASAAVFGATWAGVYLGAVAALF